jgi:hypothetical protein
MWKSILRVSPLLILAVIAFGCGSDNPTAPQLSADIDAGGTLSTDKKLPKVDICHLDDDGNYVLINVNGNAEAAHLAHGDVLPNEDGTCGPVDPPPPPPSTACVTFTSVSSSWSIYEGIDFTFSVTTDAADTTVTYVLQVYPDPQTWSNTWTETGPSTTQTGSGTFTLTDGDSMDAQRVRAICPDGSEVISPEATVW